MQTNEREFPEMPAIKGEVFWDRCRVNHWCGHVPYERTAVLLKCYKSELSYIMICILLECVQNREHRKDTFGDSLKK